MAMLKVMEAKEATGVETVDILADRGYTGEGILACVALGVTPIVPKPLTSGAKANGRFGKQDFNLLDQDVYRCLAGAMLPRHTMTVEKGEAGFDPLPTLRAHGSDKCAMNRIGQNGDRQAGVRDQAGTIWWISQRLADEPYFQVCNGFPR